MKLAKAATFPLLLIAGSAVAQSGPITHAITGPADKELHAGWFGSLSADCSPRGLPEVRMVEGPTNGAVRIRQAKVRTKSVANCTNAEVPAQVVFYQSRENYRGSDSFTVEIKDANGKPSLHKFDVSVAGMVQ